MLTLFFILLMCVVLGEVLFVAIKLAWKITKIIFALRQPIRTGDRQAAGRLSHTFGNTLQPG